MANNYKIVLEEIYYDDFQDLKYFLDRLAECRDRQTKTERFSLMICAEEVVILKVKKPPPKRRRL